MRRLGVPATARASFYVYSEPADVDALVDALLDREELVGDEITAVLAGRNSTSRQEEGSPEWSL